MRVGKNKYDWGCSFHDDGNTLKASQQFNQSQTTSNYWLFYQISFITNARSTYPPIHTMDQLNPAWFHPGSPNELMLFLDSVMTSSLCPHTKDWICFLYFQEHRHLCPSLNFWIHAIPDKDLFVIRYGGRGTWVPFCVSDFVSYLQDFPRPQYEILRPAEAQVVKRIFSKEWDLAAEKIVRRTPYSARVETPTGGLHTTSEHCNPAVWFALKGKYTIANFLADRSLKNFIERHWRRLSLQGKP